MKKHSGRDIRLAAFLSVLLFSLSVVAAEEEDLEGPIDVSNVKVEGCRRCDDHGYVKCDECKGSGISINADIPCPKCEGKGSFPCTKCDEEGMVKCTKCKLREVNGEKIRSVVSEEWKEWDKKYGESAKKNHLPGYRDKDKPEEPEKYVLCPFCEGTGKRKCPDCDGTKKVQCKRCKGDGTVKGRGQCPKCGGSGKMPCPDCADVSGADRVRPIVALTKLLKEKLVDEDEYYKRLRLLVAQEKYRRQVVEDRIAKKKELEKQREEREKAEVELAGKNDNGKAGAGNKSAVEEKKKLGEGVDWSERENSLNLLIVALASKAISPQTYDAKCRTMGLAPEKIAQLESSSRSNDPRLKQINETRKKFRDGEIDLDEYNRVLGNL